MSVRHIRLLQFGFIGIEIAIGIEIELSGSIAGSIEDAIRFVLYLNLINIQFFASKSHVISISIPIPISIWIALTTW